MSYVYTVIWSHGDAWAAEGTLVSVTTTLTIAKQIAEQAAAELGGHWVSTWASENVGSNGALKRTMQQQIGSKVHFGYIWIVPVGVDVDWAYKIPDFNWEEANG